MTALRNQGVIEMQASIPTPTRQTWRIPRLPLENWLFITFWGWVSMLVAVVVIGLFIDNWSWIVSLGGGEVNDINVTYSIWSVMAGIAIWFIGFLGGYYVHNYLPAFVANGRTRRDSAIEAAIFGGVLSAVTAVLITIGYLWERMVYAIAGWSRGTPDETMLFSSFDDYGRILVSDLLAMAVWAAGGAMIGSCFYRSNLRGAAGVAIALIVVSLVGGNNGLGTPATIFSRQLDIDPSLPLTTVTSIAMVILMAAITWWWNLKRLPLRNK